jgi:ABC-type nickel/cobalt efflux system permease component RcnA
MNSELNALYITAASIGFIHTLFGPDHYLPFVMMSWARKWSVLRTIVITLLCGLGHIASSIVLGLAGVALGVFVQKLELIESVRGDIAAWLLIGFGLAYLVWGLRKAYRDRPHVHGHTHPADAQDDHMHAHTHNMEHMHVHDDKAGQSITPWMLFVVFVFGPCEPLIPILMYPAAEKSMFGLVMATIIFGTVTISTMLAAVLLARAGISFLPMKKIQRYSHAIAGATILLCGMAIVFLGL